MGRKCTHAPAETRSQFEREILASFLHTGRRRCRVVHRLYSHWFVHKPDCTNLRHFNSSPSVPPTIAETAVMSCSECYIFISRLLLVRISLTQTVVTHFINPISLKKIRNIREEFYIQILVRKTSCLSLQSNSFAFKGKEPRLFPAFYVLVIELITAGNRGS